MTTRAATASDLADFLTSQMPLCGSISRAQAERLLFRRGGHLTAQQVAQAIIIAVCRGQIMRAHGGATLRRKK